MDNPDGPVPLLGQAGPMTPEATWPAEPVWTVPGYDVVELLGFGASGEVWLARSAETGEPVALKRLRTPRDLAARDRLRREAAALACVAHPHVVRLRTVVSAGDELVLVLDHAAGGSLSGLLAARRLSAREVVTVAMPLAEALAAVHAQGLVHGDLSPANVLFTCDGRPLLSDLGVCRLVGEPPDEVVGELEESVGGTARLVRGTPGYLDPAVLAGALPGPDSDVHGLGAVCYAALTGAAPYTDAGVRRAALGEQVPAAPSALVTAIEAALHSDPRRRPAAAELAASVFDACPAEPVRLIAAAEPALGLSAPGCSAMPPAREALTHEVVVRGSVTPVASDDAPGRSRHGHRLAAGRLLLRLPRWRAALSAVVVLCGLSMAVLVGLVWAGTDGRGSAAAVGPPAAPRVAPAAKPVDWTGVLGRLDRTRSAAFAVGDPVLLAGVYAPGSPALRRDQAVLARLRSTGHTVRGVRLEPQSVQVVDASSRRAVLEVVDVMPAYELVAADGSVTSSRPGRAAARWSVTLTLVDNEWRVLDVQRR